jgi:hypothetical protein
VGARRIRKRVGDGEREPRRGEVGPGPGAGECEELRIPPDDRIERENEYGQQPPVRIPAAYWTERAIVPGTAPGGRGVTAATAA